MTLCNFFHHHHASRKSRVCIPLLLAGLLAACGDSIELPALASDATILAFGDSLTYGHGVEAEKSYPAILEQLSGRTVINAGISGEESAAGLERLPGLLQEYQPDLLILCHGGNDILRQRNLDSMSRNLRAMIQLAEEKNVPVLLLGVPRPGLFLSAAEQYLAIAEQTGVAFIEDLLADVLSDKALKSDTVHPNAAGYRRMAEHIHTVLAESGAI